MTREPIDRAEREAFAETLHEFNDQRTWYSRKAGTFKSRAQWIDLLIILMGALVAALPVLKAIGTAHWTAVAASFLGAAIVVAQGFQRVYRYGEVWPEYRLASERMKREWRLFINGVGVYDAPEQVAQKRYVQQLEEIIAEEQKIFFDRGRDSDETEDQEHKAPD